MRTETHPSSGSCTLPSIKTLLSGTFICPFSDCIRQSGVLSTMGELIAHIQANHPTLLHELLDSGIGTRQHSPSSPTSEGLVSGRIQSEVPSPPVPMGWYDPSTSRAKTTFDFVKDWSRDDLYQAFFAHSPSRPIYGEQSTFKSSSAEGSDTEPDNKPVGVSDVLWKQRLPKRNAERKRRHVHLDLQSELGTTTSEIAYQMAERDEQMAELVPKSTSSKGPGKFDQFFSDVYMHQLSALTVQSEHEGRTKAEARIEELERQLAHYRQGRTLTPLRRCSVNAHYEEGSASPAKRQRIMGNDVTTALSGRILPPSPAPSPTITSTGEWLKIPTVVSSDRSPVGSSLSATTAIRPKGLLFPNLIS